MIKGTIKVKPQAFAAAVTWAAKFVAARPTVAVQGGIRLTVADGELVLETFNEDVSAQASVSVTGDGTGDIIVSARLLAELVKTFGTAEVTIAADDDDGMSLAAGRWTGTLPGIAEIWTGDAITAPETIGTVGGSELADLIAQTAAATTEDEKKLPMMHCVHLRFAGGTITGYGTDGYRMARASIPFELGAETPAEGASTTATLLNHVIVDAASAFTGPNRIAVGLGPNLFSLASPTRAVVLRQYALEKGYGADELIDTMSATDLPRLATVRVADLLMPMKRANLMSGDKTAPVAVEFADGKIWIHAKASDIKRKGAEDVDAEYVGPEHAMALNPQYLAAALASAPSDMVQIAFSEQEQRPGRPFHIIMTVPDAETWHHLLMPLKLVGA